MLRKLSALLVVALATAVSLYSQGNLLINGAGATFPNPIYSKWFDDYHKANATIQINYQPVGSGAGIKQVTEGTVDFGGSDGPMNDEQMKAYQDKHGSPILRFENQGNTQYTRAIPLDWDPTQYGGDQDHPVIWDSLVLGKDLTLNFQNLGPVAQYTTHLTIPNATTATLADPAGYLLSSFNRFWTYNARSKVLTEVTSVMPDGCTALTNNSFGGYAFFADFGGIIMSDASGANAMGIYGVSVDRGGSVSNLDMWKFYCWGDGPAEGASDNTAWSAAVGNGDGSGPDLVFPAGESTYNAYLITDSVQNVVARMDDLFQMGVR